MLKQIFHLLCRKHIRVFPANLPNVEFNVFISLHSFRPHREKKNVYKLELMYIILLGNFARFCVALCTFSINNTWNWLFIFYTNTSEKKRAEQRWKFHYRFNQRKRNESDTLWTSFKLKHFYLFSVVKQIYFQNSIHHFGF